MPRFLFRTYDGNGEPHLDEVRELADFAAARREAVRVLRELVCATGDFEEERYLAVDVLDEFGSIVIRARLNETLETVSHTPESILSTSGLTDSLALHAFGHTTH